MIELMWVAVGLVAVLLLVCLWLRFYPQTFYRERPAGLCDALFDHRPNWVSSLIERNDSHYVPALPAATLTQIKQCAEQVEPGSYTVIVEGRIEGFRRTRLFGFTDWFCVTTDGAVTSTATLGYSDLSNNRRWVERMRKCLASYQQ